LWDRSHDPNNPEDPNKIKAFVAGFMTHAIGDMYGHTFINFYSGGQFLFIPPFRGLKHMFVEEYVAKRTPPILDITRQDKEFVGFDSKSNKEINAFDITPIHNFIFNTMIFAGSHTDLGKQNILFTSFHTPASEASIPAQYSVLKNILDDQAIPKVIDAKNQAAQACGTDSWTGVLGAVLSGGATCAPVATLEVTENYLEDWSNDIGQGLQALPDFSQQLAQDLLFNSGWVPGAPDQGQEECQNDIKNQAESVFGQAPKCWSEAHSNKTFRTKCATQHFDKYRNDFLLGMTFGPAGQVVGDVNQWIQDNIGQPLTSLLDYVHEWEAYLEYQIVSNVLFGTSCEDFCANKLPKIANGMTCDQLMDALFSPKTLFNPMMSITTDPFTGGPTGPVTTLAQFDSNELHLINPQDSDNNNYDEKFVVGNFPPAYNTVSMTKLMLLSRDETNRLAGILTKQLNLSKPLPPFAGDNVMLGFDRLFDGDNQWFHVLALGFKDYLNGSLREDNPEDNLNLWPPKAQPQVSNSMYWAQDCQVYETLFMHQSGQRGKFDQVCPIPTDLRIVAPSLAPGILQTPTPTLGPDAVCRQRTGCQWTGGRCICRTPAPATY